MAPNYLARRAGCHQSRAQKIPPSPGIRQSVRFFSGQTPPGGRPEGAEAEPPYPNQFLNRPIFWRKPASKSPLPG